MSGSDAHLAGSFQQARGRWILERASVDNCGQGEQLGDAGRLRHTNQSRAVTERERSAL